MTTYIVFLRAVNVAGRMVKMEALRRFLTETGFTDVETHIQSGNVRLDTDTADPEEVERRVEKTLAAAVGFEVATMVRTPTQLAELVRTAPPSPLGDAARHYVMFLRLPPSGKATAEIDGWNVEGERLKVVGRDVHLWLTKSTHEAKMSNARLERIAGMAATSRNWTVVTALAKKW